MASTRAQLRSTTVVLGGMGLLAAALTACSSDHPDKRCVDRNSYNAAKGYHVVSDKSCKSGSSGGAYYYGGKKRGSWVRSGSFTVPRKSGGGSGRSGDNDSVHRGGFGGGHGGSGG
ncbi:hypothetical protein ACFWN1_21890 [Streptomyces sp. NPDC058459]|uniref:hypothetical protein n=1 Tax=Streptomyces sp. NPDC058459 TaxID=3346508 RepID=UPI003655E2BC